MPGRCPTAAERGINCLLEPLVYRLDGADLTRTLRLYVGAGEGIRTPDLLITNQLLYRTELRQPGKLVILAHVKRINRLTHEKHRRASRPTL